MTLRQRVLDFIRANPGKSAWEIAKGMPGENPGSVSAVLYQMRQGPTPQVLVGPDKGPRGAMTYLLPMQMPVPVDAPQS